jgi:group I intron endonuclease
MSQLVYSILSIKFFSVIYALFLIDYFSEPYLIIFSILSIPILKPYNANTSRVKAIRENRGKSGIYRWLNKISNKSYIGSSANLGKRFSNYFSLNYISDPKRNMNIHKALLKYDYSNFTLQILEYCEPSNLITREDDYITSLEPEYNILKKAGSSLGHKHSEETKTKMKNSSLNRTKEAKLNHLNHLKKLNDKGFSKEVRARISLGLANFNVSTKSHKTEVTNIEKNITTEYSSVRHTAKELGTTHKTILRYIKNNKLYKDIYKITLKS